MLEGLLLASKIMESATDVGSKERYKSVHLIRINQNNITNSNYRKYIKLAQSQS
jgi:hypothetical protein